MKTFTTIIVLLISVLIISVIIRYDSQQSVDPSDKRVIHPAYNAAIKTLASEQNLDSSHIEFLSATPRDWSNSCLGLSSPEEFCLQVITPGFEVKLKAQGKTYTFRTNETGSAVRLEE